MRKYVLALFLILFLSGSAYGDINDWIKGDGTDAIEGADNISDLDTLMTNYIQDPLDRLLTHYTAGVPVYYTSDDVVTVGVGEIVCQNGAGSVRRFRKNTATTAVDFTAAGVGGIDSGSARDDSSWFDIYAVADADATTFTAIAGKQGTALSDVTYYKKIGTCYNDGSDNLTSTLVHGISSTERVVQVVNTQTGARVTGTGTVMTKNDDIPVITEGIELMTLAITPTSATNKLKIDIVVNSTTADAGTVIALFQDATSNALACMNENPAANENSCISFTYYMTAGTTSSTTFRVRGAGDGGGKFNMNGDSSARLFGGVLASSITITEIQG